MVSQTENRRVGGFGNAVMLSVRVPSINYLAILLFLSFVGGFFLYLDWDIPAGILIAIALLLVPILAVTDRIVFTGRRLRRTGAPYRIKRRLFGERDRIKLVDIDQVQTAILRTIRRGGNCIYTYQTLISGKGVTFVLVSTSRNYRKMLAAVLPQLNETVLDQRSLDLRDHFSERGEVRLKARAADIPPTDILENSVLKPQGRKLSKRSELATDALNGEKANSLHSLANELRVIGNLPQAIEAFRRAVVLMPRNARLLFDFAMCLNSYARYRKDQRVGRSARAMMRLAERRAGDDSDLLTDIGEGYFQFGDWTRAQTAFRRAIERAGEKFRSVIGLAEIALHEGKIAHVIHNFAAAKDLAETPSLRRWANNEIEYFSHLNDDEEYMELEIGRMNLLYTLDKVKRTGLRISVAGVPLIVFGIVSSDDLVANIGWAVSLVSLSVWGIAIVMSHMLSARIPFNMVEDE